MANNSCKNGSCNNASCKFGGSKKGFAFGKGADKFFVPSFSGPASINSVGSCLQNGVYYQNNVAPLMRFGTSKRPLKNGAMKKKK